MKVITKISCKVCDWKEPELVPIGKKYKVQCPKCNYETEPRQNRALAVKEWERDNQQNFVIL